LSRWVEVRKRDGETYIHQAGVLQWDHIDHPTDIIEYRYMEGEPPVKQAPDVQPVLPPPPPKVLTSKDTNPKDAIGAKKAKFSTVPANVVLEVGLAMLEGACKYGRHNYRAAGVRSSVYYDAAMGHLADWWEGQDIDADSGMSHVTKAIASLVVLRDAMMQDMLQDDRPPRSKVHKSNFNALAAEIIDRYADKNPHHYTIKDELK
jgi:hypothetical protein